MRRLLMNLPFLLEQLRMYSEQSRKNRAERLMLKAGKLLYKRPSYVHMDYVPKGNIVILTTLNMAELLQHRHASESLYVHRLQREVQTLQERLDISERNLAHYRTMAKGHRDRKGTTGE